MNGLAVQSIARKELFIVEGKSAASTVRQAMNKSTQEVHAVQGKLINATKATRAKVLANNECQQLFDVLQCGVGEHCEVKNLAYTRIFLLTDPDIDGVHSRALLATLFAKYLAPLVDSGLVFAIVPPLFRLVTNGSCHFVLNEVHRQKLLKTLDAGQPYTLTRIRGVAQFSSQECAQLFLQADTRNSLKLASDTSEGE